MVTYEQLFDTLRREKSRDELQELEPDFYRQAKQFLNEKRDAAEGKSSLTAQKAQIEYHNALRVLRELYDRRERKVVTLAMHRTRTDAAVVDSDALLPDERQLFDKTVSTLREARADLFGSEPVPRAPVKPVVKKEEPPEEKEPEEKASESTLKVKFTDSVPKFVGKDMSVYGPFEKGQEATLPHSVAKILVDKGRASTS